MKIMAQVSLYIFTLGELEDLSWWDVATRRKVGSLWDEEISRRIDMQCH